MRCATEIVADAHGIGIAVRAGIHTGEVEFRDNDVIGLAVTIGKRVCDLAGPGQILVTESVRVVTTGTSIELNDADEHTLKGVPGTWHLYAIKP
jgi:class 3 adenylate cyclase